MTFESLRTIMDDVRIADPPSIAASAPVADAVAMMRACDVDVLVVEDAGHFVGVFTARDAVTRMADSTHDPGRASIRDALRPDTLAVDVDTSATGALAIMDARRCDHVAITARGRLMGVLSRYDLAAWIIRKQREQLDCAIRAVKRVGYSNRR